MIFKEKGKKLWKIEEVPHLVFPAPSPWFWEQSGIIKTFAFSNNNRKVLRSCLELTQIKSLSMGWFSKIIGKERSEKSEKKKSKRKRWKQGGLNQLLKHWFTKASESR